MRIAPSDNSARCRPMVDYVWVTDYGGSMDETRDLSTLSALWAVPLHRTGKGYEAGASLCSSNFGPACTLHSTVAKRQRRRPQLYKVISSGVPCILTFLSVSKRGGKWNFCWNPKCGHLWFINGWKIGGNWTRYQIVISSRCSQERSYYAGSDPVPAISVILKDKLNSLRLFKFDPH